MSTRDRLERNRIALENKGKPLGGGLDEPVVPLRGRADIQGLEVAKPVERGGERGLEVRFRALVEGLGGVRLVIETTLHEQGRGPLRASAPRCADTLGNAGTYEVFTPADDEPSSTTCSAFFPFAAIEIDRAGTIRCFAAVRIAEADRGVLVECEQAFELVAG